LPPFLKNSRKNPKPTARQLPARGSWPHCQSRAKGKSEKAPLPYDLTTLQRDANRLLGYTAQQTLDYLQSLYEKKICTYPRTDSRCLTDDMEAQVPAIRKSWRRGHLRLSANRQLVNAAQICNSKKVSDHHAVIPTMSAGKATFPSSPRGTGNPETGCPPACHVRLRPLPLC
jgi:DNA topoisomerase IA